jgi:hypothetical protein
MISDTRAMSRLEEVHANGETRLHSPSVRVCRGATYSLTVKAEEGVDPIQISFVFDEPATEQAYRLADVPPGDTSVVNQTAPAHASKVDQIVDPLGPTAGLGQ